MGKLIFTFPSGLGLSLNADSLNENPVIKFGMIFDKMKVVAGADALTVMPTKDIPTNITPILEFEWKSDPGQPSHKLPSYRLIPKPHAIVYPSASGALKVKPSYL